jgi:HD superfamily phosphodiesterase
MQFQEVKKFILKKLKNELPQHLTYHSVRHIKDVYDSCKLLAASEGVSGIALKLLLTAALFHDSGFLYQPKNHEKTSCEIARKYLPEFGYSKEQIESICSMIMATRLPQSPKNKLEEILADADLDYLGRDDFFEIGNKLYDELCLYGILNTEEEWNKLQLGFLESHHYFTESAIKLRQQKKNQHLQLIRSKLKV